MSLSRYINLQGPEANTKSMSEVNYLIRLGVIRGDIRTNEIVLEENRRLDQLSGQFYGTASYWWVIAAASGIGWWLQCPSGTLLAIPTDISQIERLL